MRRLLLKLVVVTAALVAAALGWVLVTLPASARRPATPASADASLVTGGYHIHSSQSDGSGTVDDIARAAARAGLQFIILTDHGDATRPPEPAYRHGVLCIDAVEVSTAAGHVVALNLRSASPFPLAGETADVVEDIHRLGGSAVAAHPDSAKPALRWRADHVAVDGFEWFNADSAWRDHGIGAVVAASARAWFRPAESVASLFQAPAASLQRWDAALRVRPAFAIAALDAHARVGTDADGEAAPKALALSLPSYEAMFRTMTQTVRLDRPLGGDARADAAAVVTAIAAGRSYSVVRAFVDAPRSLTFRATAGDQRVDFGGALTADGPVTLQASVPADLDARLTLFANGRQVASGTTALSYQASGAGAYRLEVHLAGFQMPWIVSNAISVARVATTTSTTPPSTASLPAVESARLIPAGSWVTETDPSSTAVLRVDDGGVQLRYRLGSGTPAGQYVAIASAPSGVDAIERIEFTAVSPRPTRISLQVRVLTPSGARRWRQSIYVDDVPRRTSVALAALVPVEAGSAIRPIPARVQAVLLVIDTVNARPGDEGDVVFRDIAFVAARADRR